jgi:hypothetical protein
MVFCTAADRPDFLPADGAVDFEPTAQSISGNVDLLCDPLTRSCGLSLGSLGIPVDMTCEASECMDPSGPPTLGGTGGGWGRGGSSRM